MNLETIKRKLLVKYPLFGSVVANSNFILESRVATVETNGENIYYNANFIEAITNDEQIFVFAHEICHIAFEHISRSEGKDIETWNIATDAVINAFLKQDGLPIIKGAIDIPKAINYDAEEMYAKLLEGKKKQQNGNQGNDSKNPIGQKGNNYNGGHDTHSMWAKATQIKHNENEEKKNYKKIKRIIDLGEKEIFKQNKIIKKKQLEELQASLASKSHGYGNTTNSEIRNITDIGISKPLIDWRILLKEAIKYDVDWSYQNAGIEDGVVTAYLEEMPRPETEIVLDTSGSVDETLLRNFLRECKNILQTSKVKVGCFDTQFYGFTEIKDISDIDNLTFYGGGGTNFEVAVNAFTRRVENKIIFTDGESNMPSTKVDAIWIVFGEKKINPLDGKVIYIDDKQLNKLYEMNNGKSR